VTRTGQCPDCGHPLPDDEVREVRAAVGARRRAFKVALQRLGQRVTVTADSMSAFATRGVPLSDHEHLDQVILPTLAKLSDPLPKVKQLLESCIWDPSEVGTVAAFGELVTELDAGLARVGLLRDTMPPMAWRAVHRELARAGMALLRGQLAMATTIVAVDLGAARKLHGEGESWFGAAAQHARRIATQIEIIRNSPADGPI
jgi:hypothetical protein